MERSGIPALFSAFSGNRLGETLRVGSGQTYATLSDVLDFLSTQTATTSALVGSVSASAGSVSVSGSGFSTITADDFLYVGSDYWAVRSVESDSALTLWHGAQTTVSGAAATHIVPGKFTVELMENQTVPSGKSLPNGVSILIVGSQESVSIQGANSITMPRYGYLELTHCTLRLSAGSVGLFVGQFGTGRGIVNLHDFSIANDANDSPLITGAMASYTLRNVRGHSYRQNISADYALLENSSLSTNGLSDHLLLNTVFSTDIGYHFTLSGFTSLSTGTPSSDQDTGLEINAGGKITDATNCIFISWNSSTPTGSQYGQPLWGPTTGTLNMTDCIVDAPNNLYDVLARGGVLNLVRTTRLDGSALRQIS